MKTETTIKRKHSFNDIHFTQTNGEKEIMVSRCSTCFSIGGTLTITGEQIQELLNFALKCNVIDKNFLFKMVVEND